MKTAISIPNSLFQTAEELADRLGLSRSELYQRAVARSIQEHAESNITAALNKASIVNVSQLATLDKRFLAKRVGCLAARRLTEVERGLRTVLDLGLAAV